MVKIISHRDADGITSAVFASLGLNTNEVVFPKEFGDTTFMSKDDWMLDMKPKENKEGNVIDHHLDHPIDRKYNLVYGNLPASYLTYSFFKSKIDPKEEWKLVIGMVGDGYASAIPSEIFFKFPGLLKKAQTSIRQTYGEYKINFIHQYKLLSSPVNALCRVEKEKDAFKLVLNAKTPEEILSDEEAKNAKNIINIEVQNALNNSVGYKYRDLHVVIFNSDFSIGSQIAQKLSNDTDDVILAINKYNGELSMRGDLAMFFKDIISKNLEYVEMGGHPGYIGGKIKNIDKLISDLDELFKYEPYKSFQL